MSRLNFLLIFLFRVKFIAPSKLILNKVEKIDFDLRLISKMQDQLSKIVNCVFRILNIIICLRI